jgi:NitT/TauT family transport system substrate-binding protein
LIWVAKGRGNFLGQDLDVDIRLYESGNLALKDLIAGKLDLATASEFVAVRESMGRPDFHIITILAEAEDQSLVARKDRGISTLADLANKRVGVARNTSAEYYLDLLLLLERMRSKDVAIVDILPSQQVDALVRGDVDAIMTWEPFTSVAKKELGENAISFPGQSGQDEFWLLLASNQIVRERPAAIRKFIRALSAAETFVESNRAEAMKIVSAELKDHHLKESWSDHKFVLGLHRPLILKMEAESVWLSSLPGAENVPQRDVWDAISFDALRAVAKDKIEMLQ